MGNALLFPSTECTYEIDNLEGLFWLPESYGRVTSPRQIDSTKLSSRHEVMFPVQFFPGTTPSGRQHILVYFHGNSCDMGEMVSELQTINEFCECHIFSFEFPGYGVCSSRRGFVCQAERINTWGKALAFFLLSIGVSSQSIVPFGRSIGTGPAAQLARTMTEHGYPPGGLILHSPYVSIHRIVQDYATSFGTLFVQNHWDISAILSLLSKFKLSLLIIHGENDDVISVKHGKELFNGYNVPVQLKDGVFPPDSEHNAYYVLDDLAVPIRRFLKQKSQSKNCHQQMICIPKQLCVTPEMYREEVVVVPTVSEAAIRSSAHPTSASYGLHSSSSLSPTMVPVNNNSAIVMPSSSSIRRSGSSSLGTNYRASASARRSTSPLRHQQRYSNIMGPSPHQDSLTPPGPVSFWSILFCGCSGHDMNNHNTEEEVLETTTNSQPTAISSTAVVAAAPFPSNADGQLPSHP